jgi:hypothetical protein
MPHSSPTSGSHSSPCLHCTTPSPQTGSAGTHRHTSLQMKFAPPAPQGSPGGSHVSPCLHWITSSPQLGGISCAATTTGSIKRHSEMIAVNTPNLFMVSPLSCHSADGSHLPTVASYHMNTLRARNYLNWLRKEGGWMLGEEERGLR